jgi:hypothetical protein
MVKLGSRAVDVRLKNIRPIVVPGEVVTQFHLNSHFKIAIGIENALFGAQRPGDDAAHRIDDKATAAAVRIAQEFFTSGPHASISIMRSSTVPHAEITKALLICAPKL